MCHGGMQRLDRAKVALGLFGGSTRGLAPGVRSAMGFGRSDGAREWRVHGYLCGRGCDDQFATSLDRQAALLAVGVHRFPAFVGNRSTRPLLPTVPNRRPTTPSFHLIAPACNTHRCFVAPLRVVQASVNHLTSERIAALRRVSQRKTENLRVARAGNRPDSTFSFEDEHLSTLECDSTWGTQREEGL